MATYVNDLRLKEIGTGESSGTWGTETNTNLELIGEALGFGTEAITTNADTHTTTVADGSTDPGRAMYLKYTGTLDSACTITIAPNTISRMHFIENATSGSQNIIISQGSGANVTIPAGDVKAVYLDGAGSGAAVTDAFASLNVVDLKVEDDLTVTDDVSIGGALTLTGNGDFNGDLDVDGTTNLDVVDIDGAVDMASTLAVGGVVTANAGVVVDNITIDGNEIDVSSGDLTLDVAGDIVLDADGAEIILADGGTQFANLKNSSSDFEIKSLVQDKDIKFIGNDNNSDVTALTLDMSDAGSAYFNNKVGIGTTSPASLLSLQGDAELLRLDGTSDTTRTIFFRNTTAANPAQIHSDGSLKIRAEDSGTHMEFHTVDTERMRIDSQGFVGINDNSPDVRLHVNSGTANIVSKFESTDEEVRVQFKDSTGTTFIACRNDIRFGNDTSTERMRVNVNGHVLIGTTTNQGVGGISFQKGSTGVNIQQNMDGTSGGAELYVFRRNSTQIGSINQSSTNAVTYNTSSDARLKDVTGSSRGLDVINNLNPVAYNWKADNHADEGLIAQEVEKLVPNAVNQDEDGYYSMDYSKLVTHLVKGMQEQQEQIESLKSEILSLKEK